MAILENANDVTLTRTSNTRRAVSNSGYARIERAGPTFYGLEVSLPILETSNYRAVNNELIDLEDGVQFLESSLPSQYKITNLQSSTPYSPVTGTTAGISSVTNNTEIVLNNVESGTQLLKGDYIQFTRTSNNTTTKVYQITEDTTATSTNLMTVKLNTGTISTPFITTPEQVKVIDLMFDFGTSPGNGNGIFNITTGAGASSGRSINTDSATGDSTNFATLAARLAGHGAIQSAVLQPGTIGNRSGVGTIRLTFTSAATDATITFTSDVGDTATFNTVTAYSAAVIGDGIRVGNDVEFKFMLAESPQVTLIPQNSNNNLYLYSTINLQEVL